jgi:hypothetical protein
LLPLTAFEYTVALKFMLIWQKAMMVRRIHFLLVDQAYAVGERLSCSLSTILRGSVDGRERGASFEGISAKADMFVMARSLKCV